ncbi:MAG: hypothetical protein ACRDGV_10325 [Candidatus Limnocylindria bacterium]
MSAAAPAANGQQSASSAPAAPFSRLQVASAIETWPNGATPLVRWLRANPDVIGELIATTVTTTAEELPGLDAALFEEADGTRLLTVVELGASSEPMLGALLTHLAASDARRALWICGEARPEHLAALSWLNRAVDVRCHLARLRAARIGTSQAAPILELILRPPRASDRHRPTEDANEGAAPEPGRRAEDWREIVLGEPTG